MPVRRKSGKLTTPQAGLTSVSCRLMGAEKRAGSKGRKTERVSRPGTLAFRLVCCRHCEICDRIPISQTHDKQGPSTSVGIQQHPLPMR